jgi:mono/diheme cytochrome c family protein
VKKFLKWAGIVVLVVVVLIGGWLASIALGGMPNYEARKIDLKVEATPARIENGRKLASHLCMACHMDPVRKRLVGTQLLDMPDEFGKAFSKNITQHPEKGIGKWTDGDIAWLLRTGIHPHTGDYVPPWMPKWPNMADEDLYSIIAWLRSDDPYLEADDKENVPSEPTFFAKFLTRVAFEPFEYPAKPIPYPDVNNTVALGKYLATSVYDCYGCHSEDFATYDALVPENTGGYFGGGMEMKDAIGNAMVSLNISSSKQGISKYTRPEFISMIQTGIRPDGTPLRYPMMRMANLTDHELGSIYDYLKTVPAIDKSIARTPMHSVGDSPGAKVFSKYGCYSCHGKDGLGYASLKLADAKYPDDSILVDVIKDQLRYNPDSFMPKFDGHIPDTDLALLASHVRELCKQ